MVNTIAEQRVQPLHGNYKIPPFLLDENPAQHNYAAATELFALFGYLKGQGIGVFSIREALQAVSQCSDGTLKGFHLSTAEAWECINYVASLGVGVIEMPSYPANKYGQASNRELIAKARENKLKVEFAAHARCLESDVQAAHQAGFKRIHLFIGTSKIKQATARATIPQLAEKAFTAIKLARTLGFTSVRISTEDAFRTTLDDYEGFFVRLQELLEEHNIQVDGIGMPDTVGISTMDDLGQRIAILQRVGIRFSFLESHVHNDIGNADEIYTNSLLLCMRLGITMLPDFSILGIGERNGIIGLSSMLEAIYRRLILLYPRKMTQIRQAMRQELGTLPGGELFVNRYRDMDTYFYHLFARIDFLFDRSPFSANTEFDGSGVHADTTLRAYQNALDDGWEGQEAIDIGNIAYCGALAPYDIPLRIPVLACFGCGKSNVHYWREHEGVVLRPATEIAAKLEPIIKEEELPPFNYGEPIQEASADEYIAQLIRLFSIKGNGLTHQKALEYLYIFYR